MMALRMAVADLRDSWSAWACVSFTFLVTGATLGLSALVLHSAAINTGLDDNYRFLLISIGATNVLFCSMVALAVVGTSTALVVTSRRGAIARLLLAGAAPGQVVRMLLLQLIVVTLVCSVAGNAVALSSQGWVLRIIAEDRGYAPVPAVFSPPVLLASSLYCAAVAMMGGLRQARRATAIPPVEALRASSGAAVASTTRVGMVMRWTGFVMICALIVGAAAFFRSAAEDFGPDAFQNLMQMAAFSLPVFGLGLSLIAPSVVGPLTRLWTRLVPIPGATWHLARHTVISRSDRLVKSVIPVMFAVGLLFGMMAIGDSVSATLLANGFGFELDGSSLVALLALMGLSIAIAFAGSVSNLMMMTRQRDAELALDGVIGATPLQQASLPALEATMVTGTAALLGLTMAGVSIGVLAYGLPYAVDVYAISLPLMMLLGILLVSWVITLLATVLPSIPSLRRPAPRVIAQLVAS